MLSPIVSGQTTGTGVVAGPAADPAMKPLAHSACADLAEQVDRYLSHYPEERTRLAPLLNQLSEAASPFDRKILPGHVTASGIVIRDASLLMILHPFLLKWLQPGGHVEYGETPLQAAMREVLEETGLYGAPHPWHEHHLMPFDIDVHGIPANPAKAELAHWHYDFRYVLCDVKVSSQMPESDHEVAWRLLEEVDEPNLRRLIDKVRCRGLPIQ